MCRLRELTAKREVDHEQEDELPLLELEDDDDEEEDDDEVTVADARALPLDVASHHHSQASTSNHILPFSSSHDLPHRHMSLIRSLGRVQLTTANCCSATQ